MQFQLAMKRDLIKNIEHNDLILHSFQKGHYEFSAVLKDATKDQFIYVSISDVRYFKNQWFSNVLIRTMKHDKDWSGGMNQYCHWEDIGVTARKLIERTNMRTNKRGVHNDRIF